MRLIDADKLQKHFKNCINECKNTNSYSGDFEIALSATKNQPSIEIEEEGESMANKSLQVIQKRVLEICNYYKSEIENLSEDEKRVSPMNSYVDALEKVLKIIQEEVNRKNRKAKKCRMFVNLTKAERVK